jgi:hypothetical protein
MYREVITAAIIQIHLPRANNGSHSKRRSAMPTKTTVTKPAAKKKATKPVAAKTEKPVAKKTVAKGKK